ncbi:hypothetical protein E0495_03270 [Wolbachia pipientis]|uniref:Uncharacterized protein n=1 Tax=Wolbachia pipientis TaxID=955 RepID=A0A6I6CJ93_WOLPI|nr:hypothetical protein E0495_03270 [Wolbachia pipientis]
MFLYNGICFWKYCICQRNCDNKRKSRKSN